ncbi:MAG: hypothetical protein QM613_01350 [Micrococcaceae bacterium]
MLSPIAMWQEAIPIVLVTIMILYIPGLVFSAVLGFRKLTLVTIAPVVTFAEVGFTTVLFGILKIPYYLITFIIASVFYTFLIYILKRFLFKIPKIREKLDFDKPKPKPKHIRPAIKKRKFNYKAIFNIVNLSLLIAITLSFITSLRIIGHPENIIQTVDVRYHLSAIRWIYDSHNASPFHLSDFIPSLQNTYYPSAWHGTVYLASSVFGSDFKFLILGLNSLISVIYILAWPISMLFFARQVFGNSSLKVSLTVIFSCALPAFPYLGLVYGGFYPNSSSAAFIPIALGFALGVFKENAHRVISGPQALLGLLLTLAGIGFLHPTSFMASLLFVITIGLQHFIRSVINYIDRARRGPMKGVYLNRKRINYFIMFLIFILVYIVMWDKLSMQYRSIGEGTVGQSIIEYLQGNVTKGIYPTSISIFVFIGILLLLGYEKNKQYYWVLTSYVITGFLYVISNGSQNETIRFIFTGLWYGRAQRIIIYYPIFASVIATIGVTSILNLIWKIIIWIGLLRKKILAALALVVKVLLIVLLGWTYGRQGGVLDKYVAKTSLSAYSMNPKDNPAYITWDGLNLMKQMASIVPAGTLVANDNNAAALSYAVANVDLIQYGQEKEKPTQEEALILNNLNNMMTDAQTCQAVKDTGVKYAINLNGRPLAGTAFNKYRYAPMPGLENLDNSDAVTLVAQQGPAKLYSINDCDPTAIEQNNAAQQDLGYLPQ